MGETKMNYNYLEEACQLNDELVAYRRYLHANPELGLSLPGTKAYVMKALSDFGYQPLEYGESGVAVLLGAAKLLKRHEDEIEGTVKILFQPGEETLEGLRP